MNKDLIHWVMHKNRIHSYTELARKTNTEKSVISRMLSEHRKVGATFILQVHERFGIEVKEIRSLIDIDRSI